MGKMGFVTSFLIASWIAAMGDVAQAGTAAEEPTNHWLQQYSQNLTKAEDVLRHKPRADWTADDIAAYEFNALYSIDFATKIYIQRNKQHPLDDDVLNGSGILNHWPGNPFNDWKAVKVLEPTADFSPGDIVKQLCPPAYYSGLTNPVPLSYMITINGPAKDFKPNQPVKSLFDWATVPPGSMFVGGSRYSTTAEKRARIEKAKKAQTGVQK